MGFRLFFFETTPKLREIGENGGKFQKFAYIP